MSGVAIYDATQQGPEVISLTMTPVLIVYSTLYARWAWVVQPQNLLLCGSFWILFCHADWMVDVHTWIDLVQAQYTPRPREFAYKNESCFYHQYENIHLYLGSECVALSGNLVAPLLEQARDSDRMPETRRYFEGQLGHDLSNLVRCFQSIFVVQCNAKRFVPCHDGKRI